MYKSLDKKVTYFHYLKSPYFKGFFFYIYSANFVGFVFMLCLETSINGAYTARHRTCTKAQYISLLITGNYLNRCVIMAFC